MILIFNYFYLYVENEDITNTQTTLSSVGSNVLEIIDEKEGDEEEN